MYEPATPLICLGEKMSIASLSRGMADKVLRTRGSLKYWQAFRFFWVLPNGGGGNPLTFTASARREGGAQFLNYLGSVLRV